MYIILCATFYINSIKTNLSTRRNKYLKDKVTIIYYIINYYGANNVIYRRYSDLFNSIPKRRSYRKLKITRKDVP